MKSLLETLPPPVTEKRGWPWTVETDPDIYASRSQWPALTVVTPSYNQAGFIEETIRSVLLQNYPNLEYFVFDGGSDDGTVDILKKYGEWITYWVSERDNGQGSAINKGLRRGKGDMLAWLNSDDTYCENGLQIMMAEVMRFADHVAYVGSCEKVDAKGNIFSTVTPRHLYAEAIADWGRTGFFYQPACFFRRSAFDESGGINESLQNAMDVDLWMKLALRGGFRKVDAIVAQAKIHPDMKTLKDVPLRDAETAAVALAFGYREAALDRLNSYARYYAKNQASPGFLIRALAIRLLARAKGILRSR